MPQVSDEEAILIADHIAEACRGKVQEGIAMQNIANWYLHRNKEILTVEQQEIVDGLLKKYRQQSEEESANSDGVNNPSLKPNDLGNDYTSIVGSSDLVYYNPPPIPNDSIPIWDLVIKDMQARDNVGRNRYGTPLQANNGRDALQDAYEEALDLVVYLRQVIEERKG